MFILPVPKKMKENENQFRLSPESKIILHDSCSLTDLESAKLLQREIETITGHRLPLVKAFQQLTGSILMKNNHRGNAEGYQISITEDGIMITGEDSPGLFYGVQTLRQIFRNSLTSIPCLEIQDEPFFRHRGFYHDITRGKVPTLDTLMELADRLSFYKINQLQLYVEHTFAFRKMSEVWTGADPITAEEILLLDEYCVKRHIELVPSLSTFGHLYQALSSQSFSSLCELEDSAEQPYMWIARMLHHTLDVTNPKSIEFVEAMLEEFVPLFSSDKFNICCDETFDLGKGRSRELADKLGTGRLYLDFVNKIIAAAKKHGKKVMLWGDMILNHPELMSEMDREVTLLNWNYAANPDEKNTEIFAKAGIPQYVCPSVWGWNRLMNDMDTAFSNITKMTEYGEKYGGIGVLNTDWGDFGHINFLASSIPGMIYGAHRSWNPGGECDIRFLEEAVSRIEYGDRTGELIGLLHELSRQQKVKFDDVVRWKENITIRDPRLEKHVADMLRIDDETIMNAYNRSLEIEKQLFSMASDKKQDLREFCCAARGIALFNAILPPIRKYERNADAMHVMPDKTLAEQLEYWFDCFSGLWRQRNKESELYRIRETIQFLCGFLRKGETPFRNVRWQQ